MLKPLFVAFIALSSIVLNPPNASAQSDNNAFIPPALKDWRAWVLKDQEFRTCPLIGQNRQEAQQKFQCAWPSRLSVNATSDGATFSIHWQADAPSWIPLPGDNAHWPQQVTVNNQRQPIVTRDGVPNLYVATSGAFDVAGKIVWKQRPQVLSVPNSIGLIALTVDGKNISPIERQQNSVTLGRAAATARETDAIDLRVFRKLTDGVPAMLETRILVTASGQAREEVIGPVLPDGFVPTSLTAEWPAKLDDDGRLHLQLQAGEDTVTLLARATSPLTKVVARVPGGSWPKQETWSYESAPEIRVTNATSALQVDPRQAGVPNDWTSFPAFALGDAGSLQIDERSRGLGDQGNRLNLHREAWLDFSGDGWFARDSITGQMLRGWRLDVAAPYLLERADAANSLRGPNNSVEPLLVTKGAKPDTSGVEWRTPAVSLAASVRVASSSSMPVAGWQDTFDQVNTTLHIPYGYKLIAAPGADSASGSWMSNWTLLDAFVCAILVLLAWRFLGIVGGVVAVVFLLVAYQESGAPFWLLLIALALALIVRALPIGKLRAWSEGFRRVAVLLLILAALPFVADELRFALYPQLEGGIVSLPIAGEPAQAKVAERPMPMSVAMPSPAPPPATEAAAGGMRHRMAQVPQRSLQTIVVTGSNIQRADLIDHYAESTVVQTGKGEPNWYLGTFATLNWSGPVVADQNVHLLIAPPWVVRPLRVILVLMLAWLVWQLTRGPLNAMRSKTPMSAALLVVGLVASMPIVAQTFPPDDLLKQLQQRLTQSPKCAPNCASIGEALINANGDSVTVALDIEAMETSAVPIPWSDASAMIKSIKMDGAAAESIVRQADETLLIRAPRGVHRVEIEFAVFADKIALNFPLAPGRVAFTGTGWDAAGINDDQLLAGSLNLTRARSTNDKIVSGAQQFPTFLRVERHLNLGLQWGVNTTARRVSPSTGAMTANVPVLPGEHVDSAGTRTEGDHVVVAMGDGAGAQDWHATLDKSDTLTFVAPPLADRAEEWHVVVSPTWHAEFSGVPESTQGANEGDTDYRDFTFNPLPGETLTIKITRPAALQGDTRALDAVNLASEAGQHASTHTLNFRVRASQGGEQTVTLPTSAEVLDVKRNGELLTVRAQQGKLTVPVTPGDAMYEVRFRESGDIGFASSTPAVALGLPAANITMSLTLPADRWLLATSGPRVGPAVLYWGELLVMIGVAFALSRIRRTKLRFHHWLLLGLGFSTFSWEALVVVVAWLFAFDWRSRTSVANFRLFNLAQVGLAALTLVALLCLMSAIPQGLLGQPDMHVVGNESTPQLLHWFADRSADALPTASAFTVPMWVYKVLMLLWALWLANALIGWLRDAFSSWTRDGYWRAPPPKPIVAPPTDTNVTDQA